MIFLVPQSVQKVEFIDFHKALVVFEQQKGLVKFKDSSNLHFV